MTNLEPDGGTTSLKKLAGILRLDLYMLLIDTIIANTRSKAYADLVQKRADFAILSVNVHFIRAEGYTMIHLYCKEFFTPDFPFHAFEQRHALYAPHSHEFFEIGYIADGQGTHRLDDQAMVIQPGDVYLIRPGEVHMYYPAEGTTLRLINVLFLPTVLDGTPLGGYPLAVSTSHPYVDLLFDTTLPLANRVNLQGMVGYQFERMLDILQAEVRIQSQGYQDIVKSLFCTMLVWLNRAYVGAAHVRPIQSTGADRRDAVVAAALRYVELHFTDAFTLDDVAAAAAVSPSYLAHVFKARTNRSLIRYLHEYRIRQVCDALHHGVLPVQQVAAQAGFNDLSFFYRVFQRTIGCSPTEYRNQAWHNNDLPLHQSF